MCFVTIVDLEFWHLMARGLEGQSGPWPTPDDFP